MGLLLVGCKLLRENWGLGVPGQICAFIENSFRLPGRAVRRQFDEIRSPPVRLRSGKSGLPEIMRHQSWLQQGSKSRYEINSSGIARISGRISMRLCKAITGTVAQPSNEESRESAAKLGLRIVGVGQKRRATERGARSPGPPRSKCREVPTAFFSLLAEIVRREFFFEYAVVLEGVSMTKCPDEILLHYRLVVVTLASQKRYLAY